MTDSGNSMWSRMAKGEFTIVRSRVVHSWRVSLPYSLNGLELIWMRERRSNSLPCLFAPSADYFTHQFPLETKEAQTKHQFSTIFGFFDLRFQSKLGLKIVLANNSVIFEGALICLLGDVCSHFVNPANSSSHRLEATNFKI